MMIGERVKLMQECYECGGGGETRVIEVRGKKRMGELSPFGYVMYILPLFTAHSDYRLHSLWVSHSLLQKPKNWNPKLPKTPKTQNPKNTQNPKKGRQIVFISDYFQFLEFGQKYDKSC